jgi:MFS family permease
MKQISPTIHRGILWCSHILTYMGSRFVCSVGIVPQWFSKRRSFANSIAAAGSGIGGLTYSLASQAMIQSIGLGWAFRVLAVLAFAVNTICTILIRDRNKAVGAVQLAFDVKLFKRKEFILLQLWGFFSMLGYIVLLFSLPNYAMSIGLPAKQGSIIGALLNLGQGKPFIIRDMRYMLIVDSAIGRPFVGYFSDAAGRINMAGICTFLAGLFCLVIWIFAKSFGVLIFFALLVGTVSGTYASLHYLASSVTHRHHRFWATVAPVGAEVVGLKILPSALSIMWLVLVLPCTFAEPIGLQLRTIRGDIYLHAQIFTGLMYIGAALCMWVLRAWKIGELERAASTEEERELELQDEDCVPRARPDISRNQSRMSVKSKAQAAKGLWSWQRV